jgi:hypothetical protein
MGLRAEGVIATPRRNDNALREGGKTTAIGVVSTRREGRASWRRARCAVGLGTRFITIRPPTTTLLTLRPSKGPLTSQVRRVRAGPACCVQVPYAQQMDETKAAGGCAAYGLDPCSWRASMSV